MITTAQLNSIGFNLVKEVSYDRYYIYQQYLLKYNIITNKVVVTYGRVSSTYEYIYIDTVPTFNDLVSGLVRNNVIPAQTIASC